MAGEGRRVRFAGYAAVFDRLDNGGDVIRPGAFTRALEKHGTVPLLWQHKSAAVIGRIETIREDKRGLRVIGSLAADERGRWAASLLKRRAAQGLSFGYRVRSAEQRQGHRELRELDLVEVSLVTNPMQPLARVHAVESR